MHHTVILSKWSLLTSYSHVIMTSGLLKALSFYNSMGYSVKKYIQASKKSQSPNHTLKNCTQNLPYSQTQTPNEARIISPLPTLHARYYRYTFTLMFWECPGEQLFWSQVMKSLSKIPNKVDPSFLPILCLLNINSRFPMSIHDKWMWLSGLTAAKKMLVLHTPHTLLLDYWWHLLLDLLTLELSAARSHGAKDKTLKSWSEAVTVVKTVASRRGG